LVLIPYGLSFPAFPREFGLGLRALLQQHGLE
jgi:hypothetical protein